MSCLWDRAGELHRANKFLEALELYTEILAYDPLDIKARNNRACVYDDLDRYKEALHDLNIAIALCPEDGGVYAYNYRGYINIKLDRYEEALHDLNMAIALCPEDGNAYAYNCRGYINIKMKHYKQALDDYRISLKLTYPEYNPNKLIGLIHKNQLDKGIIILKYLLNNGFYVYLKGNIREKMIIMRRISDDRIVLSLNNDKLHIGKTIRRHIRQHGSKYELRFDSESDFEVIFNRCIIKYKGKSDVLYLEMLHHFFSAIKQSNDSPKAITTALYKDGVLVAGDVAVQIGRVFSSYTAFHDEAHTGNILFIL
ncbi:MAG: tetratricopeptide repeat protein, partial [Treponema sp.]|nr:tetratricopeptide repeat protein [Treponema sp.]